MGQQEHSLWEIAVLALLREAPMHPYQMQALLRQRHKDDILVLKRGSLYHAINRLTRAGFIAVVATGRSGRRPERTTYRITAAGRHEFIRSLRQRVEIPRHGASEFMGAMSFLIHLAPADAAARLEERARRLEREIDGMAGALKAAAERVHRINLVESEYLQAIRRAEMRWVRDLIAKLRSGSLTWNLQRILREVRRVRAAAAKAGRPSLRAKRN